MAKPAPLRVITAEELDGILGRDDLGSELVAMPEWGAGVAVRIRGLSMDDVYAARKAVAAAGDEDDRGRIRDREWLRRAIVEPALTEAQADRLLGKSADAVLRLINRINALNGTTQEAAEQSAGEFPAQRVA